MRPGMKGLYSKFATLLSILTGRAKNPPENRRGVTWVAHMMDPNNGYPVRFSREAGKLMRQLMDS